MKVLLIRDVRALGKAGEIKEVKDGYGQNFLINKGFAKLATIKVIENWKAEQAETARNLREDLARLKAEKIALEATTIKIEKPLAPIGIKGSVGNAEISKTIAAQLNIDINKKHIGLKRALKSIGLHKIDVKLGHGIHATLKVEIVGV